MFHASLNVNDRGALTPGEALRVVRGVWRGGLSYHAQGRARCQNEQDQLG